MSIIVVDAGHGSSKEPGAVFKNYVEKKFNLEIALALGKGLVERKSTCLNQ